MVCMFLFLTLLLFHVVVCVVHVIHANLEAKVSAACHPEQVVKGGIDCVLYVGDRQATCHYLVHKVTQE